MRPSAVRLALAALVLSGLACSRTDVFAGAGPEPTLTITPSHATVEEGRSAQFTATVRYGEGEPVAADVTWSVRAGTEALRDAGAIDENGIYTAPTGTGASPDAFHLAIVTATLKDEPDVTADANVTIRGRTGGEPARLVKVSGDNQLGVVGRPLPQAITVRVVDEAGLGVPGIRVQFTSPVGELAGEERVTDPTGAASANPTAGHVAGVQGFDVTSEGLTPVVFSAEIESGPVAKLFAFHPEPTGPAGSTLATMLVLRFADEYGNLVPDESAEAIAPEGGAAIAMTQTGGESGTQPFRITLAPTPGTQPFTFRVPGTSATTTFEFLALGGAPATLELVSGADQTGSVGMPLAQAIKVRLLDANGFAAGSGTLAWSAPDGGAFEGAQTTPTTDGTAAARVVLGNKAGVVRIVVDAGPIAGSPLTITARATPGAAARLQPISGGGQTTTAGQPFGGAFAVRVTDAFSNGVAGVTVRYEAASGGGSVAPAEVVSGPDGLAQALMTAGAAGPQKYRASSAGLLGSPLEVTNNAVAPAPISVALVGGHGQTGRVLSDLAEPLVVKVTQAGVPVGGQTVVFAVALGDGSLRPTSAITATDGVARTTARLGSQPGAQRFSASVAGAVNSPVFFDATATGRSAAVLRVVSGGSQIGAPGAALAEPFVVEALDELGAPVAGLTLTFAAPAGAAITRVSPITDAQGRASAQATLAPTEGEQVFTVTTAGGLSVTIHATATSSSTGTRLRITAGNNQANEVGLELAQKLEVRVTNGAGAPLAGVEVKWRAEAELALVGASTTTTDADGYARVTARLGKPLGAQRFFAEADGANGSPAIFGATGTKAPAERIVVAGGDGQSALVNQPLAKPLVARVVDRVGNPVPAFGVTFRAGPQGGSVSPSGAQPTNPTGEISASATLGATVGPQTFFAEGASVTPAVFTATATNAVERLSIAPQGLTVQVGASVKYGAVAIYTDGTSSVVTNEAAWTSSSASTAGVSDAAGSKGVAQALAQGQTTITATYQGRSGSTALKVDPATLRSVVIYPADVTIVKGSTRPFRAMGTYSNNVVNELTESCTWTSNAPAIAGVSNTAGTKGLVKGTGVGEATVSATCAGVTGTRAVTVSAAPLAFLEVTPANVAQPAGTAAQFRAIATYEDGTVEDVTPVASWSSSDTALMTLQNLPAAPGRATFLAAGTPEVIATYGGRTAKQKVTITSATVVSLSIFPRDLELSVRDFMQVTLIATYSDGTVSDAAQLATWSTNNAAIADVSNAPGQRGLVTAIGAGTATVTARIGAATATVRVSVDNATVFRMRIFAQQERCPKGGVLMLRAGAIYSNGSPADISDQASWSSSNPAVAIVGQGQQGGVVQCLTEGQATITAAWGGQSEAQVVTVTAAELQAITIAPAGAQLAKGDTRRFFATGRYSDGSTRELSFLVTWTSTNPAVLTASNAPGSRGVATALAAGTAEMVATLDGVSARATVTVTNANLVYVVVSPANPVARVRERAVQFNATAVYDDGTTQDVTDQAVWSSSVPSVAIVSNDPQYSGVVMLNGPGSTQIGSSYGGRKGQTTLTVR